MDIFEDLTRAVDQAAESARRSGRVAQTKAHIANLRHRRERSLAALGNALYPLVREDEKLRAGNEKLIESIEQFDKAIEQLEAQLLDLSKQAAPAQAAPRQDGPAQGTPTQGASGLYCNYCGAPVMEGDMYCSTCGARVGNA